MTCRTCCRPLNNPYRTYDDRGRVTHGCISSDHTGHLLPGTESYRWHIRPEAKRLRKQTERHIRSLLTVEGAA
jgi:hypothetical protein